MSASAPQVLCLGEALVDRLGLPGADPAVDPAACEDRLGGAPANVACALAQLGTAAAYAGRLGRDAIGVAFARLFADRGVDISALQWDDRRPSRIVLVRREASGERQFGGFAGDGGAGFADQALAASALAAALEPLLEQARWLLLGTIPLASPASAEAAWAAVQQAAAKDVAIAVDVNWRPTFWDPAADPAAAPTDAQIHTMLPLLRQSRLLKCAAEEARWLFARTDPAVISAALPHQPLVVVTDGEAPLRWGWAGAPPQTLAPPVVAVVDSTGAGDAFCAGLLHGLCAEPALLQADHPAALAAVMRFAAACGALVCQGAGAIDPQADDAQIRAFLATRG
ncbi:MAG: carbohydrate kinase [Cyanobacteriota bacterium]|nr:carbohydrate kinase [Cyanobacteriota bacterium]